VVARRHDRRVVLGLVFERGGRAPAEHVREAGESR
jgi:hypothetical protein